MKKKSLAMLTSLLAICICLSIAFTMSSKGISLDDEPNDYCDEPAITRNIAINFNSPNQANFARQPNFQSHIPSADLRFNTLPGALLMIKNKWFCKITVTSGDCSNFSYELVLSSNSNVVPIQLPPDGSNFHLEVVYYETFDAPHNAFDFNLPIGGTGQESSATRLVHIYEESFMTSWNAGISQPIYLTPSYLVGDVSPWGGVGNEKPMGIGDYDDANDFITNRGN